MNADTINRIMQAPIDYDAPGAAMRLAWNKIARDQWSRRDFTPVTPSMLSASLRFAWGTVKMIRDNRRKAALANQDPDIHRLRVQRSLLFNKPFRMPIENDLRRIDREISERTAAL